MLNLISNVLVFVIPLPTLENVTLAISECAIKVGGFGINKKLLSNG